MEPNLPNHHYGFQPNLRYPAFHQNKFSVNAASDDYNQANEIRDASKYTEAIALLNHAISLFPTTWYLYTAKTYTLILQGNIDQSLSVANDAVQRFRGVSYAHESLGDALAQIGKYNEALAAYDKAISIDPNIWYFYTNKAYALSSQGKTYEALAVARDATQRFPGVGEVYNSLVEIFAGMGKYNEALASYDKAISVNPNIWYLYRNKAYVLSLQGKTDEALAVSRDAIQRFPQQPEVYKYWGDLLLAIGQYDDAITAFDQGIQVNPNRWWLYVDKAYALSLQGQFDQALRVSMDTIKRFPQECYVYHWMGDRLQEVGRYQDALSYYNQAIGIHAYHWLSYANKASVLSQQSRFEQAIAVAKEGTVRFPEEVNALIALADRLREAGQYQKAVSTYNLAINMHPTMWQAYNGKAAALSSQGKIDESISVCNQALALFPESFEVHHAMSERFRDIGQLKLALQLSVNASQINPDRWWVSTSQSYTLLLQGKSQEALSVAHDGVTRFSQAFNAYSTLSDRLREFGRFRSALDALEQAISIYPHAWYLYTNQAYTLFLQGNIDKALYVYENAINRFPEVAETYSAKGWVLKALGQYGAALATFELGLVKAPNHLGLMLGKADTLLLQGNAKAALAYSQTIIDQFPEKMEAYHAKGKIWMQLGQYQAAVDLLSQAILMQPNHIGEALVYMHKAKALLLQGNEIGALSIMNAGVNTLSELPAMYGWRGDILQAAGRHSDAAAAYNKSVTLQPIAWDVATNLAFVWLKQNKTDQALSLVEDLLIQFSEIPEIYDRRAEMHQILGSFKMALEGYQQAFSLNSDSWYFYINQVSALLTQGDAAEALRLAAAATMKFPELLEVFVFYGDVLKARGLYGDALKAYDHALRINPSVGYLYLKKASVLALQNKPQEAEAACKTGLQYQAIPLYTHVMEDTLSLERVYKKIIGDAQSCQTDSMTASPTLTQDVRAISPPSHPVSNITVTLCSLPQVCVDNRSVIPMGYDVFNPLTDKKVSIDLPVGEHGQACVNQSVLQKVCELPQVCVVGPYGKSDDASQNGDVTYSGDLVSKLGIGIGCGIAGILMGGLSTYLLQRVLNQQHTTQSQPTPPSLPPHCTPIGLSLKEGKPIELIKYNYSSILFNYDQGLKKTSWVGQEDAILVYDHNHNEKVDGGLEIVLTKWSTRASTDFEALLETFDTNHDRIFNHHDREFKQFYLWQDKNQNGVDEAGELVSLSQMGLQSINLTVIDPVYGEMKEEYGVLNTAQAVWEDGRVTSAYDLVFTHE